MIKTNIMKNAAAVFLAFLIICGASAAATVESDAASQKVSITVPTFSVALNGVKVDSRYSQYPLIVYKNITYFPMTYWDTRFLGLTADWTKEGGLVIKKEKDPYILSTWSNYYPQKTKNGSKYTATVAQGKITVNGKSIDNAKEIYPLLVFRDITYFPMTWRFGVDEFDWFYSFNNKDGLKISAIEQNRIQDGSTIYYETSGGKIMAIDEKKWSNDKTDGKDGTLLWQIPNNSYNDACQASFIKRNNKVYLIYRSGGGVMGTDHTVRLAPDKAVEIDARNMTVFEYDGISFGTATWVPPAPGNLFMKRDGDSEWKPVGNPDILYGWIYNIDKNSRGGSPTDRLAYDGIKYVYVLGFEGMNDEPSKENAGVNKTGVYRVNIETGETVRISPQGVEVTKFDFVDGKVVY